MSVETTVGRYLVTRLEQLGLRHVFGVPGDYNMSLLDVVVDSPLKLVCNCNELNGGYAADGYARLHGLGAMFVTYNVGGFSAYNAVAGAWAESVPVVLVSGAPTMTQRREQSPMHHLVAEYDHQLDIYRRITVDAVLLDDPKSAPERIDRALTRCVQHKKPVYLEVPMDQVNAPCRAPLGTIDRSPLRSVTPALEECVREAAALLAQARSGAILVGHEIARFGLHAELRTLLQRSGLPVAVAMDGLSLVPHHHPAYRGIYRGAIGDHDARVTVEGADRLLCLGTKQTDISSGNFTASIDRGRTIVAHAGCVQIGHHAYDGVRLTDFLPALAQSLGAAETAAAPLEPRPPNGHVPQPERAITSDRLFARLAGVIGEGTVVVSDTGDALFQSSALPRLDRFVTQSWYLSIGYALPAGLGTALAAPDARTWVFIGDGAFQMTAQEVSTIVRNRVPMVIVLLNNDGYVIERLLHHEAPYNDINRWRYADLPRVFGDCTSLRVATEGDLESALRSIDAVRDGPVFVEIVLERNDCSEALKQVADTTPHTA